MYNEIAFGLACFSIGFCCGIGTIITLILTGVKALTKRKKPEH